MKVLPYLLVGALAQSAISQSVPEEKVKFSGGKLVLEKRSSFSPDGRTRNPFWPIGWTPLPVAKGPTEEESAAVDVSPEALVISTTVLGAPPLAIVNGKEVTLGSRLSVSSGGGTAELRVIRIGDGFVDFEYRGRIIRSVRRGL